MGLRPHRLGGRRPSVARVDGLVVRARIGGRLGDRIGGRDWIAVAVQILLGLAVLKDPAMKELTAALTTTITAALAVAVAEIGRRLDLRGLPTVLAGLVGAWARGDFPGIDPKLPAFKQRLEQLLLGNDVSVAAYMGSFNLNLNGMLDYSPVNAVPVPAAVWLFGSGLLGLVGVARRKAA